MHNIIRIVVAIAWFAATLIGSFAGASEDDLDELPRAAQPNANNGFEMAEANFDQWVYQGAANGEAGRDRIKARLKIHLDELERVCQLTPEQKAKLTLAARGDMKRFFDQVEVVRLKFLAVRRDQNAFNQIWQDIQPLQQKVSSDLFADKSMFAKTLQSTLNAEQLANYQRIVEDRSRFRYRAMIAVGLTTLEKTVPLRHSQRQAVMEMLVEETRPPLIFGAYDFQYFVRQFSRLPAERLEKLLDQRQRTLLEAHFAQFRGMEQVLIQQGVIAKDDVAPVKKPLQKPADASRPDAPNRKRIEAALETVNDRPADATQPSNR